MVGFRLTRGIPRSREYSRDSRDSDDSEVESDPRELDSDEEDEEEDCSRLSLFHLLWR